jgi:hypothetical protein
LKAKTFSKLIENLKSQDDETTLKTLDKEKNYTKSTQKTKCKNKNLFYQSSTKCKTSENFQTTHLL